MAKETVIDLARKSVTEWELVDDSVPERETINELLSRLTHQVQKSNGYPIGLFLPLYHAIGERLNASAADATVKLDKLTAR